MNRSINERHQFLRDAAVIYLTALYHRRVVVTDSGASVWCDERERERWENLHAAAEACVKRYYGGFTAS